MNIFTLPNQPPPPPPPEEKPHRVRFMQIAADTRADKHKSGIYGLDEEGVIWYLNNYSDRWGRILSPISDDPSLNPRKDIPNE